MNLLAGIFIIYGLGMILAPLWLACASRLRQRAEDLEDRVCGGREINP